ncbi:MAG: redoxin domain-containing protein [Paludibacter sp.]|uniref:AhpC/TSA family protein n=1 Tax=Flavobacterium frigoris TaxID=229204 RepID=A0A1H9FWK8_FLAFI|nr:redoxin domain-containing protein [Flavobacterium frigoris]NDP23070.1 redoxin domain-containing protein [Paludibacter sp.]SEQ42305.1 AhpC/TSA family protein [Flavobacterium frigoris]
MKKIFKIVLPLVFVSLISLMGYKIVTKIKHKKEIAANIKTIPAFIYQNLNGESFSNKNLKTDTPTLFIYFNSECEYCNEEAHMIEESVDKFRPYQLVFVSFEKPELIKTFAQKHNLLNYGNIHFVCDSKVTFATTFDVQSLPCLVIYDKHQQLIEKLKGQTKVETILKKLQ